MTILDARTRRKRLDTLRSSEDFARQALADRTVGHADREFLYEGMSRYARLLGRLPSADANDVTLRLSETMIEPLCREARGALELARERKRSAARPGRSLVADGQWLVDEAVRRHSLGQGERRSDVLELLDEVLASLDG